MNRLVVIVDMQNDFISGSLGSAEAQATIPHIVKIIEENKDTSSFIYTRDTHEKNYLKTLEGSKLPVEHCIKGTNGWEIINELKPSNLGLKDMDYMIFDKPTFGSIDFLDYIRKHSNIIKDCVDEIIIVGVCTDICVISNALMLKAVVPEKKIIVDAKCCAGVTPEKHKAALEVMRSCHIEIINDGE